MTKVGVLIAIAFASVAAMFSAGANASPFSSERPGQSARADGSYQVADAYTWQTRVCCTRNGRYGWAALGRCQQAGGQTATNKACRKYGNGEFDFSYMYNNRVCCKRGNRDWWSTYGECQRANGYQTANRECRDDDHNGYQDGPNRGYNNGGNNGGYDGNNGGYNGQNGDERVCCKRGNQDWWSSRRDCSQAGGYQVMNKECRN